MADHLRLERRLRGGAGAGPGSLRPDVDQPHLYAAVRVQVGDADLTPERPRLQERHAGEPAGVAAQRVAAEHEVDAAAQPLAQRRHALAARVDAVVEREHDAARALRPQLARVLGHVDGTGREPRVQLRQRGQRDADHADVPVHRRGREGQAEVEVGREQRERQLGAPAAQVVEPPVELVVARDRDVDRQLAQGEERPDAVAQRP